MKNSVFIFLLSLLVMWGCKDTQTTLTEAEKEKIKKEVKDTFNASMEQFSLHNVEQIPQYFLQTDDFIYSGNGILTRTWDDFYTLVKSIHTNPKFMSYSITYEEVIIKVLSPKLALVNAKGKFVDFPINDTTASIDFTETILMQNIDGKWLIVAGHESTNEQLSP